MSDKKMNWPLGVLSGVTLGGILGALILTDQSTAIRIGSGVGTAAVISVLVAFLNRK